VTGRAGHAFRSQRIGLAATSLGPGDRPSSLRQWGSALFRCGWIHPPFKGWGRHRMRCQCDTGCGIIYPWLTGPGT
jgi:hypothetical protein